MNLTLWKESISIYYYTGCEQMCIFTSVHIPYNSKWRSIPSIYYYTGCEQMCIFTVILQRWKFSLYFVWDVSLAIISHRKIRFCLFHFNYYYCCCCLYFCWTWRVNYWYHMSGIIVRFVDARKGEQGNLGLL